MRRDLMDSILLRCANTPSLLMRTSEAFWCCKLSLLPVILDPLRSIDLVICGRDMNVERYRCSLRWSSRPCDSDNGTDVDVARRCTCSCSEPGIARASCTLHCLHLRGTPPETRDRHAHVCGLAF